MYDSNDLGWEAYCGLTTAISRSNLGFFFYKFTLNRLKSQLVVLTG